MIAQYLEKINESGPDFVLEIEPLPKGVKEAFFVFDTKSLDPGIKYTYNVGELGDWIKCGEESDKVLNGLMELARYHNEHITILNHPSITEIRISEKGFLERHKNTRTYAVILNTENPVILKIKSFKLVDGYRNCGIPCQGTYCEKQELSQAEKKMLEIAQRIVPNGHYVEIGELQFNLEQEPKIKESYFEDWLGEPIAVV